MSQNTSLTPSQRGCGFAVFAGLVVLGLGLIMVLSGLVVETVKTFFWTKTPCTILVSERIAMGPESAHTDGFLIRYRYTVAGQEYTSDRFAAGMKESFTSRKLDILLSRYQKGVNAVCYVDKTNPAQAVLQRGSPLVVLMVLFPLIFVGGGAAGIFAMRRKANPSAAPALAGSSWLVKNGLPLLFFGLFTLVGGLVLYFITIRPLMLYMNARSWPATPCEVVSSSVGSHRSSGKNSSTTYSIDIVYRYTVEGREYLSDRYELMDASSSGRARKAAVVKRYPAGSKAVCYVNPQDPTEAMLNRQLSPFMLIGLGALLFLLIGVGGFWGMIRSALKSSSSATFSDGPALPLQPSLPGGMNHGRAMLTADVSPRAKFITCLIIAVLWNGIFACFIPGIRESWGYQRPDIFSVIFTILMGAIGVGLIGFMGMMFLNLFNPRVAVSMNPRFVKLGDTVEVEWGFQGKVERIHRLTVVLEGREEIVTGSGKNRRTRRDVFSRLPIIETIDPHQIRAGHGKIVVPENLKPTADTGSRKVVWELQVRGEIPRYPDVSDDFEITVREA